jgi:hypothetical protein
MPTEMQTLDAQPTNPLAILAMAVERGADPDQLDKLLALQERFEKNEAAKAFSDALATFQAKCPPIVKEREAGQGNFKYAYAAYEDDWKVAGPLLTEVGITVSFSTEPHEKGIIGTIFLRKGIHVESRTMYVPLPGMRVNDTQQYGAAVKYVKRYLLEAALNIVTQHEADDDAQGCYERITEEQCVKLQEWITEKGVNLPRFLAWAEVSELKEMPADKYPQAIEYLKRK